MKKETCEICNEEPHEDGLEQCGKCFRLVCLNCMYYGEFYCSECDH